MIKTLKTGFAMCAAAVTLAACAAAGGGVTVDSLAGAAPVAATNHGKVEGFVEDGVLVFKGVRYGADTAPVRFAAPQEPATWSGVVPAKAYGDTCPQTVTGNPGGLFGSWAPNPRPGMSEDCLFLNVWTPALNDGARRPVMVWFHGGGFSSGDGSSNGYDGVRLVNRGDVVVVTVNHRLNAFGHLYLAGYGDRFADSGNAGVLDMVQALEWVRDNAASFGGDPNNVMIFGESGGGAKVSTLMSTDAAKGLFHRAVVQSGAWLQFIPAEMASAATAKVVEKLGLTADTIDQILTLPEDQVRAAMAGTGAGSGPVIDGRTLTRHGFTPDAAPQGADVPLMLGWNRTESTLFEGAGNPSNFALTWETLPAALKTSYPDMDANALIASYRALEPDSDPSDIFFHATTDGRFARAHVAQATRKAAQPGAPAYLYMFNWDTPVQQGQWRVPHALEIGFVFDNVAKSTSMAGSGADQQKVADVMADTWIAFARNGNPDNPSIPHWAPYDETTRAIMVLDASPELVNDARGPQLRLFDDRPLGVMGR